MEANKAHIILDRFNETIEIWIGSLDGYNLEMLCRQPVAGSWSMGQVCVHIMDDTTWMVEQMRACLLTAANSEKEMHENARTMFRNNDFPDTQLTGPSTGVAMRQPESKEALRQGLISIKDQVNQLYFASDPSASMGKTQHPGLQYFNAVEWLQFAEMHMRHHLRQKKRIDDKLFSDQGGKS
ncbi:MAG TPA: DinB family protein [Puia sp.]|jgi:hypothetical protein